MKRYSTVKSLALPLTSCIAAVALEVAGREIGGGVLHGDLSFPSFLCYMFAFSLGALRSPALSLPFALATAFLLGHEDCWMGYGVLPGASIMPSWTLGTLGHVIGRIIKRGWERCQGWKWCQSWKRCQAPFLGGLRASDRAVRRAVRRAVKRGADWIRDHG